MLKKSLGKDSLCTHSGALKDNIYGGAISPLYLSTSYDFRDEGPNLYPRYFNTPNQKSVSKKIADLEFAEAAMVFSSGMAAISNTMMALLRTGDHIVVQKDIYGGTRSFICNHLEHYGITYSFTEDLSVSAFKSCIQSNTKLIYLETPSNPLLKLVDLKAISTIAKFHSIITIADNTFASPIIQNPIVLGIDIVVHSATKYFGGHSDISAGAVASSQLMIDKIWHFAKDFGANLSEYAVWLLERSLKTLSVRFLAQQNNATKLALFLDQHPLVEKVYYPGLTTHKNHYLAKTQMKGFGAMLSFDLAPNLCVASFLEALQVIKPSMSLAGVESTVILPSKTSHALLTEQQRDSQEIKDQLIRFSSGIETYKDLELDLQLALEKAKK